MTVEDFYDFRKSGVITSKTSGGRVFFFAAKSWGMIERELFKTFSSGAAVMLNEMGRSYGRTLAKEAMKQGRTRVQALESLRTLSAVSGWGSASFKGDVALGKSLQVAMKECIFCVGARDQPSTGCQLLTGVVVGIVDEAYGGAHAAKETRCLQRGDDACLISVELSQ